MTVASSIIRRCHRASLIAFTRRLRPRSLGSSEPTGETTYGLPSLRARSEAARAGRWNTMWMWITSKRAASA